MLSYTNLRTQYGTLSQNTTSANLSWFDTFANIEHRYLLQKYFSNEATFSITTQGAQTLTLTGTPAIGDISATLTAAWTSYNTIVPVTFSDGSIRNCRFFTNSTAITWDAPLTAVATTSISVQGLQFYPLPPNYSRLKDLTINVGQLRYVPTEILTREEWDKLNVFPYYGDIPNNFFIFPGGDHGAQIGIWPIPSTTGNLINFNYKIRVPDLSIADYSGGTISVPRGGIGVTGTSTAFVPTTNAGNESRWIQIAQPIGDNLWYQIANIGSTTALTLYQPYGGINVTGATASQYVIGQMPILMEDFHDMLLYKPLYTYFSTIGKDPQKAANFKELYDERLRMLEEYAGSSSVSVNLADRPQYLNPNLFGSSFGP